MSLAYRKTFYFDENVLLETTELGWGIQTFFLEPNEPADCLLWNSNFIAGSGCAPTLEKDGLVKWSGDSLNEWVPDTYSNQMRFYVYTWDNTFENPTSYRLHGRVDTLFMPVEVPE